MSRHTLQICENGHLVNQYADTQPAYNADFCPDCTAETITECQECDEKIPGNPKDIAAMAEPEIPTGCGNCGAKFPWAEDTTENKENRVFGDIDAGFEHESIGLDPSGLSDEEIEDATCDHSHDKKEITTIPKSGGVSIMGSGANVGTGDVVIVCKVCEKIYSLDDSRNSGTGSLF